MSNDKPIDWSSRPAKALKQLGVTITPEVEKRLRQLCDELVPIEEPVPETTKEFVKSIRTTALVLPVSACVTENLEWSWEAFVTGSTSVRRTTSLKRAASARVQKINL